MVVVVEHMMIGTVADIVVGIELELVGFRVGFGSLVEPGWWLGYHRQRCTAVGIVVGIGPLAAVVGHRWIGIVVGTLVDTVGIEQLELG